MIALYSFICIVVDGRNSFVSQPVSYYYVMILGLGSSERVSVSVLFTVNLMYFYLLGKSIFIEQINIKQNINRQWAIDHLSTSLGSLQAKYPSSGAVILGDFNQLNTDQLCRLTGLVQTVNAPTRGQAILNKILTTCNTTTVFRK